MFFVIDFETSALTPWEGIPLTLGIVPVSEDGVIFPEDQQLYVEFPILDTHVPDWHYAANLRDTAAWWHQLYLEESPAFDAAWNTERVVDSYVYSEYMANRVQEIAEYLQNIHEIGSERFLCANPVAFDKMWMDYLFAQYYAVSNPYHYRNLCLRSMRYGLEYVNNHVYGSSRNDHTPEIPHHALHDARAEALDLIHLMDLAKDIKIRTIAI